MPLIKVLGDTDLVKFYMPMLLPWLLLPQPLVVGAKNDLNFTHITRPNTENFNKVATEQSEAKIYFELKSKMVFSDDWLPDFVSILFDI